MAQTNSRAVVYGVGTTDFGRQPEITAAELVQRAVLEAFQDAGTDGVQAVYVGTVFGAPGTAQRALQTLGITRVPILTYENACASGTTAFHEARLAVESGRYDRVLVVGVETMTSEFAGAITPTASDIEGRAGLAMPGIYAMVASMYEAKFGLDREALAKISVKNHKHGTLNPRAQHGELVTVEEVLSSRMIADPLTLLQCCDIADAAAAAVIGKPRGVSRDVPVLGTVLRSGGLWDHRTDLPWGYDLVRDTAQELYEATGRGPEDVDLFEVHDAFTIGELSVTESLGLAAQGEGAGLVHDGHTALGGRQPVNASGGLLSRGHPLGATGVAQVAECVWQLRGDAGDRQVDGARRAVVETMGGGTAGIDGNGCVVVMLGD